MGATLASVLVVLAASGPCRAQCELEKFTSTDVGSLGEFGKTLSLSGDVALIGAPDWNSAFVFRRLLPNRIWVQEAELTSLIPLEYGAAVSIYGDRALVGDPIHDNQNGAAYVYHYDGLQWTEEQKLIPDDPNEGRFGSSAFLVGELALIGASEDPDFTGLGAVYVFRFDVSTSSWMQEDKLVAPDPTNSAQFGHAVVVDDDVLVITAIGGEGNAEFSGSAYVYRLIEDRFVFEQELLADDGAEHDRFGEDAAVHDGVIVVGAEEDDDAGGSSGSAYTYRYDGGSWNFEQKLTASDADDNDSFGKAVGVHGDLAIIGAYRDEVGETLTVGAAYVFRFDGREWIEQTKLQISDGSQGTFFGGAIAFDGEIAIIGANSADTEHNNDVGAVYAFAIGGPDCDGDFQPDLCETDCNRNEIPDECELADGSAVDCNGNGVPDDCDVQVLFSGSSGPLSPIGAESPQEYVLLSPPAAEIDDVHLIFSASADLSAVKEFIVVELNDTSLGNIFVEGAEDCPKAPNVDEIVVPRSTFNNLVDGGHAFITMEAANQVNADLCDPPGYIVVTVEYLVPAESDDDNNNGIPDECEAVGDLDGDGVVGGSDLFILLGMWGPCDDCDDCLADIYEDCVVDVTDLILLLGNWG